MKKNIYLLLLTIISISFYACDKEKRYPDYNFNLNVISTTDILYAGMGSEIKVVVIPKTEGILNQTYYIKPSSEENKGVFTYNGDTITYDKPGISVQKLDTITFNYIPSVITDNEEKHTLVFYGTSEKEDIRATESITIPVEMPDISLTIDVNPILFLDKVSMFDFTIKEKRDLNQSYQMFYKILEGDGKLGPYNQNIFFKIDYESFQLPFTSSKKGNTKIQFTIVNTDIGRIVLEKTFSYRTLDGEVAAGFDKDNYSFISGEYFPVIISANSKDSRTNYTYELRFNETKGLSVMYRGIYYGGDNVFPINEGENYMEISVSDKIGISKLTATVNASSNNGNDEDIPISTSIEKIHYSDFSYRFIPENPSSSDKVQIAIYGSDDILTFPYTVKIKRDNIQVFEEITQEKKDYTVIFDEFGVLKPGSYTYTFEVTNKYGYTNVKEETITIE